ncbi:hypothetical protein XENORESO_018350 [Xenotaenia resolanae]|uniref:Uncharacterized protein n=1 Tax=Xenotaenia resolanae TaxID=208358 RepID=A0ABV0WRM7_9TELE
MLNFIVKTKTIFRNWKNEKSLNSIGLNKMEVGLVFFGSCARVGGVSVGVSDGVTGRAQWWGLSPLVWCFSGSSDQGLGMCQASCGPQRPGWSLVGIPPLLTSLRLAHLVGCNVPNLPWSLWVPGALAV